MKFNEKLFELRKSKGLSQDEIGEEVHVSRQTVSKWETGQSYPDFQRLVKLSDYFGITLDELVRDIDVQDIRDKDLTEEKIASIYKDIERFKNFKDVVMKVINIYCYIGLGFLAIVIVIGIIAAITSIFN